MPTFVGREVGATGYGLMSLTWPGSVTPQDRAFDALDVAIETGTNFWNGGLIYGTADYNSLHLLRDYFTQRPEAANDVVLSIKAGLNSQRVPDGSDASVRKCVEDCVAILPPTLKRIDIFQCARVDPNTPIESTMKTLKSLVQEGKIGSVGLSEVKANTIERANAIIPIAAVEAELSLFETNILTNGVASTCAHLGIPIIAYSPLGRGFLTGKVSSTADLPAPYRRLDKFKGENFKHNLKLVEALQNLSEKHKGQPLSVLALSWIRQLSGQDGLGVFVPICGSSKAENVRSNSANVSLSEDDFSMIGKILDENAVVGERAYAEQRKYLDG